MIFQLYKNNCLCTYRYNNYVDNSLKGINLFILKDYQVFSHDACALKVKEKYWTLEESMCLGAHE